MTPSNRELPLRVAVVGTGLIANEAHMPAWRDDQRATVTWVVDNRSEAVESTRKRWGIPNATTDWRALLDRDDIDVADICLPAVLHAEATVAFLERGIPVLVEKPVALTLDDVAAMRRTQEAAGVVLMVAENWPYSSAYRHVEQVLAGGGEQWRPIMLQARHESGLRLATPGAARRVAGDRNRLGYLFAAGVHTINLARYLVGEIAQITGFATPADAGAYGLLEDDSVLSVQFAEGAIGSFAFTGRSRHVGERRLFFRLIADRGVIEFDVWSGWVQVTADGVRTAPDTARPSVGYAEEVTHFIDCIVQGRTPRTSIGDQEHTMRTLDAAYRALQEGRIVSPDLLVSPEA